MKLRTGSRVLAVVLGLGWGFLAEGGTINVNTNVDEDNNFTTGPAFGQSKGCSLREALQSISNGANYNDCTGFSGTTNTINLAGAGGTIVINSAVPIPGAASGTTRNALLPFVTSSMGTVIISTGTVSCDAQPNGSRIFTEQTGAALTLTSVTVQNCTAGGGGIGIQNTGGDLTLNTVTFTNVKSDSGGQGGAISHSGGTLNINNGTFTSNETSDVNNPSAETGEGGALFISNVELPKVVNINNTAFTTNVAARNGGAICINQGDALGHTITITNGAFSANVAKGGTGGNERGGGAIFASTDVNYSTSHLDLFLIANGVFGANVATHGQGGAILLLGQLSSIDVTTDPLNPVPAALFPATGGIIGSDFSANLAQGAADAQALGGSGGAIYARGNLSIEQTSFEGNASQHGSGGAIALRNTSTPNFVNIANTTFNLNTADQAGGAIGNIDSHGTVKLVNDTLSADSAAGTTTAGNTIAGGGEVYNNNSTASAFGVMNTILANATAGGNCAGQALNDLGHNLQFNPNSGCGAAITAGDPVLAVAPALGGPPNTFVKVLIITASSSLALGTGDPAGCSAQPIVNTDATGAVAKRPLGDPNCDIGAFESGTVYPVELLRFAAE